jgi:hypothetical protein
VIFTLLGFLLFTWSISFIYLFTTLKRIPLNEIGFIVIAPIIFASIIVTSIYIHNYEINFKFTDDNSITERVKIELVKMHYETWFRLLLTILAGYAAIAISFTSFIPTLAALMDSDKNEQFLIFNFTFFAAILVSIVFLVTICSEIIAKIFFITNQLKNIKKINKSYNQIDRIDNYSSLQNLI